MYMYIIFHQTHIPLKARLSSIGEEQRLFVTYTALSRLGTFSETLTTPLQLLILKESNIKQLSKQDTWVKESLRELYYYVYNVTYSGHLYC